MWCRQCQSDVVAEAIPDSGRALCATCGTDITPTHVAAAAGEGGAGGTGGAGKPLRHPRELLARWAEEDATDPLGPLFREAPKRPPDGASAATVAAVEELETSAPSAVRDVRGAFGAAAAGSVRLAPTPIPAPTTHPGPESSETAPDSARRRIHLPSVYRNWPVDEDLPRRRPEPEEDEISRLPLVGQMFAYLGVLTLFVGSVLVLLGHFGNLPNYAPTGWIVATAGQMLLFLGVVTLISAGLEQAREMWRRSHAEVAERLARLERAVLGADDSVPGGAAQGFPPGGAAPPPSRRAREERIAQLAAEIDRLRAA